MFGFKDKPQSPSHTAAIDGKKNKYLAAAQHYNNEADFKMLLAEANFEILNSFLNNASKEVREKFMFSYNMDEKDNILRKHANDADDRLWRGDAYMFLEKVYGAK
tara:strand:- start:1949 stop:2263 length:315 start_codon:yes stop_codon:yes gene_type:complete